MADIKSGGLFAAVVWLAAVPGLCGSFFPDAPFGSKSAGTTGAAFLKLPAGARLPSMGGAAAAGAEGSEALFWNPSGIARPGPTRSDLSVAYNHLLEGTYVGSAGYARSLGRSSTLGVGFVYFSQSPLTAYNAVGDETGKFRPYDLAVSLAYAQRVRELYVGGAVKLIRSSLADVSGTSAAADIGVQALHITEVGEGALDVGASISNLGPPIKLGGESAPLPFRGALGMFWHTSPAVNSGVDFHFPVDQDPYVSLGVEAFSKYGSWKGFLRAGFNQSYTRDVDGLSGLTAGGGVDGGPFRLDYAWIPYGDLGSTNRVSLAFRF